MVTKASKLAELASHLAHEFVCVRMHNQSFEAARWRSRHRRSSWAEKAEGWTLKSEKMEMRRRDLAEGAVATRRAPQ